MTQTTQGSETPTNRYDHFNDLAKNTTDQVDVLTAVVFRLSPSDIHGLRRCSTKGRTPLTFSVQKFAKQFLRVSQDLHKNSFYGEHKKSI